MSISGVSSVNTAYQQSAQAAATGLAGYMQQLGSALQSGNVPAAQQALTTVESSVQGVQATSSSSGSGSSGQGNPLPNLLKQGLGQIGKSLQAGNLGAARADFASLQQRVKQTLEQGGQVRIQHFRHNAGVQQPGTSSAGSSSSSPSSSSSSGTTINTLA